MIRVSDDDPARHSPCQAYRACFHGAQGTTIQALTPNHSPSPKPKLRPGQDVALSKPRLKLRPGQDVALSKPRLKLRLGQDVALSKPRLKLRPGQDVALSKHRLASAGPLLDWPLLLDPPLL